jgi:prepilin-type processing-associated H-X9-DG protein
MKCHYAWGFGSWHAGTTNFVLCDGSVRGISDSINITTMWYLTTPDGGEILPEY